MVNQIDFGTLSETKMFSLTSTICKKILISVRNMCESHCVF